MQIDGFLMLVCSVLVFAGSGALTYLFCVIMVIRTARNSGAMTSPADTAVVLGVNLNPDGTLKNDYIARLERAKETDAREIWVLGGVTSTTVTESEARAGRAWLIENSVPDDKINIEEGSRHTLENLSLLRDQTRASPTRFALISNRYHLARVGLMASGLGMDFVLCAAENEPGIRGRDYPKALAEAFFIHWYYTGKAIARLLGHKGMLARIS
ncbi:MAG: YdcF family protein [Rhodospirillales bacterium]|nr:YdcF family protein [Rhodospirillales bacterium]